MIQNLKKSGKKGFTLAELLIVVAIIAVLTAIAVPLFVGSLNKAQKSVEDANIRTVRSTAVVVILNLEAPADEKAFGEKNEYVNVFEQDSTGKYVLKKEIGVQATVTSTGSVENLKFISSSGLKDSAEKQSDGSYTVKVLVKNSDITATFTDAPVPGAG